VHLARVGVKIDDLTTGFCDGVNLVLLLDQLKRLENANYAQQGDLASRVNRKPKILIQMIENINLALDSMKEAGINLIGVTSNEIVSQFMPQLSYIDVRTREI